AAVPEILAGRDVRLRGRGVRLLDEGGELEPAAAALAASDVSVARLRGGRHDAESDEAAGVRGIYCPLDGASERGGVSNGVVGGQRQQERIWIGLGCVESRRREGRRGVLADLLEDDGASPAGEFLKVRRYNRRVRFATDDDRRGDVR